MEPPKGDCELYGLYFRSLKDFTDETWNNVKGGVLK